MDRRRWRGGALTLAALLFAAGCRHRPEGSGPYADIVSQAIPAIEKAVGVPFKHPPKLERRTRDQVRQFVLKQVSDTAAQRDMAGSAAAYKLLGMIPDTLDMRQLFVDLLTEQVIGFYDPSTKVLYVVDGAPRDQVRITIMHELVHALQDQYMNLDSLQTVHGDDDRAMAAQAVIEGQATYDQLRAMLGSAAAATAFPEGWDRVRESIRNARDAMPVYARAPLVIQETLIFPYLSGLEFVRDFDARRPHAEPWDTLPASTSEVLHPPLYFASPRPQPLALRLAVHGATPTYENDLGEFETRLFLYQHLQKQDDATRGAAGWAGDRYVIWGVPSGSTAPPTGGSIAWATAWTTAADAADFYALLQRAVDAQNPAAHGRRATVTTGVVAGHPTVLLVDTPASVTTPPVSLADITVAGGAAR